MSNGALQGAVFLRRSVHQGSGGLRFAPAPPNVSCVICCANNLYPSGPSPYTCPGVDKPPDP